MYVSLEESFRFQLFRILVRIVLLVQVEVLFKDTFIAHVLVQVDSVQMHARTSLQVAATYEYYNMYACSSATSPIHGLKARLSTCGHLR